MWTYGGEVFPAAENTCKADVYKRQLKRNGSNHDIYHKGKDRESVPRHTEIDEDLAKAIIKRRGLK